MRIIRFILLVAAFGGGYYVGHLPESPDVFRIARGLYHKVNPGDDAATDRLADSLLGDSDRTPEAHDGEGDPDLVEAAMAYLRDRAQQVGDDAPEATDENDPSERPRSERDSQGYRRPTPRR